VYFLLYTLFIYINTLCVCVCVCVCVRARARARVCVITWNFLNHSNILTSMNVVNTKFFTQRKNCKYKAIDTHARALSLSFSYYQNSFASN